MKMMLLMLVAMVVTGSHAFAQTNIPPECRVLPEHKASNDVAYKAGVDVHGKPVVPADVNADPMGFSGQTIVVPLTIDLAKRLQNQNIPGINMEGTLGFLEVAPDGRVTYNGQDLTSQVHVLCGKGALDDVPPANGHKAPDIIEYAPVKETKPAPTKAPAPVKAVQPPSVKPLTVPPQKAEPEKGELIEGGDYREEGQE